VIGNLLIRTVKKNAKTWTGTNAMNCKKKGGSLKGMLRQIVQKWTPFLPKKARQNLLWI
jgi:hypothetical protein